MRRAVTAGTIWSAFLVVVFAIIGCRTNAPETIAAGENCFRCRRVIVDARLAAEMLNGRLPTKYRSPGCVARYVKAHQDEAMTLWVTDYPTGIMVRAERAWYVPILLNDRTGERDYRAYGRRDRAEAAAEELGTGAVRWRTVVDHANTNAYF
jgi:hypothetical protein